MLSSTLFEAWQPWQVALADTVAIEMIRLGITPEQMRELVREYMAVRVASVDEKAAAIPGAHPYRHPHRERRMSDRLPRPVWQREEERGLYYLHGACPRCGSTVEGKRMCPHVSPRIRSQLACISDACDWVAVSVHSGEYLERYGVDGNVEVQ